MTKATVYGTFDNQGDAAYLYDGEWYNAGTAQELSQAEIKFFVFKNSIKWEEYMISYLGLNKPEYLVRFDIEI